MSTCHLLVLLLNCLLLLPHTAVSIKCYECFTVTHPYYVDEGVAKKLCKNFDYSEDFIVDCGNSTFCRKTVMKEVILHSLVETERGCAGQVYDGLVEKDGVWYHELRVIDNVYKEECDHVENYGLRDVKIENCYCRTDLCNSSSILQYSVLGFIVSVILLVKIL